MKEERKGKGEDIFFSNYAILLKFFYPYPKFFYPFRSFPFPLPLPLLNESQFVEKASIEAKKCSAFSAELSNQILAIIRRLPQILRLRLN